MTQLQIIQLDGRPVAVTVGADEAVISESLQPDDRSTVERMCAYALQVAGGHRPGPYRDEDAELHARAVAIRTRRC
jgi:hypothetical protein